MITKSFSFFLSFPFLILRQEKGGGVVNHKTLKNNGRWERILWEMIWKPYSILNMHNQQYIGNGNHGSALHGKWLQNFSDVVRPSSPWTFWQWKDLWYRWTGDSRHWRPAGYWVSLYTREIQLWVFVGIRPSVQFGTIRKRACGRPCTRRCRWRRSGSPDEDQPLLLLAPKNEPRGSSAPDRTRPDNASACKKTRCWGPRRMDRSVERPTETRWGGLAGRSPPCRRASIFAIPLWKRYSWLVVLI